MIPIIEAALRYAAMGWPVFPCSPITNAPLLSRDRDADGHEIPNTGGVRKASTEPDVIRHWFNKWPTAMLAAAAGHPIGAFVLDVDVKDQDGRAALALLEDQHGPLGDTWEASTPSGGLHLYFRQPAALLRNRVGFAPGLDVRSTGASITLPPSRKAGGSYRWKQSPWETGLASAPTWLINLIAPPEPPRRTYCPPDAGTAPRYAETALRAECADLAGMGPNSGRNQRLFQAAARLAELAAGGLLDQSTIETALEDAAIAAGLHLDDGGMGGIRGTIASGVARGLRNPRGPKKRSDVSPMLRHLQSRRSAA